MLTRRNWLARAGVFLAGAFVFPFLTRKVKAEEPSSTCLSVGHSCLDKECFCAKCMSERDIYTCYWTVGGTKEYTELSNLPEITGYPITRPDILISLPFYKNKAGDLIVYLHLSQVGFLGLESLFWFDMFYQHFGSANMILDNSIGNKQQILYSRIKGEVPQCLSIFPPAEVS